MFRDENSGFEMRPIKIGDHTLMLCRLSTQSTSSSAAASGSALACINSLWQTILINLNILFMRSYQIHELIYMRKIIIKINARGAPAHGHITVTGAHQQACANFLASFLFVDLLASIFYAGFFVSIHSPLISLQLRKKFVPEFFVNFARGTSDHIAPRNRLRSFRWPHSVHRVPWVRTLCL